MTSLLLRFVQLFVVGLTLSASLLAQANISNSITITEVDNVTTADYPVHIGRPFAQGEILDLPQAVVDGQPVYTQADVLARWPDGSVKHAILTFHTTLQARSTVTVTFRNQPKGKEVALGTKEVALDVKEMLGSRFDFDAVADLTFSNGPQHSISARNMLSKNNYSLLDAKGPLATSIYIGDHSGKSYDVGAERANPTTLAQTLPSAPFYAPPDPDAAVLRVQDASGWRAPMTVQVIGHIVTEDVRICSVDTDVTPHQLTVCDGGRYYNDTNHNRYSHEEGSKVYPDIWQNAKDPKFNSFRPIFIATFFPRINKVRVQVIGEIADTEKLQDLIYRLRVTGGESARVQVYPTDALPDREVVHRAGSRWILRFWIGGEPSKISINHNVNYLARHRFIPNFDPSLTVSESTIDYFYQSGPGAWRSTRRDLFQPGSLSKAMGNAGGRLELGPYPAWVMWWLYTGDYRMLEQSMGNADLGAAWPMNFREGSSTKPFDSSGKTNALGLAVSLSARPTNSYIYQGLREEDIVHPVGVVTTGDWEFSASHLPDLYSVLWMLTADHFYLEQMIFWDSFLAVSVSSPHSTVPYGRPYGVGAIYSQVRGDGWVLRHRAQTAFLIPDYYPEKAYITSMVHDAIAVWEGARDIRGTSFEGTAGWTWGNTVGMGRWGGLGVPPLKFWDYNPGLRGGFPIQEASAGISPWMQNILIYGLGRARELGFPTGALLKWVGSNLVGQLTDPGFDPYFAAAYEMPTASQAGPWFQSWQEVREAYLPTGPGQCVYPDLSCYSPSGWFQYYAGWGADSYPYIVHGAASMVYHLPGGPAAWQWIRAQLSGEVPQSRFSYNPQWAILPRD